MVLTLILKEKERTTIQDLQTQEKSCIEKYGRYAQQAKDPELKNLFQTLQQKERETGKRLTFRSKNGYWIIGRH